MPVITLPDNTQKSFDAAVSVSQVAESIGAGLARAAIAGKVDDCTVDLSYLIENDAAVAIITNRSPEALSIVRHSCAHLLAQAVKQLFPSAQVTIGPVIEEGFFYDFAFERPFNENDLLLIETRMRELAKANLSVTRKTMARNEAIDFFTSLGEHYKAEIINDIPEGEILSLYQQGEFIDLCRGPHVPQTGKIKAFKLMKVAGAYWRGDSNNAMLTRIYGTAFLNEADLDNYLTRLSEAEKRDHRKIAKALDLFHTQEEAPGMVFWHPNGWVLYQAIEQYMREVWRENGYHEVHTPQIVDRSLWERSGHWDKFRDGMFITQSEERTFAIKPMNCPCHIQIFNQGLKSYRDLPLRLAEFGNCHRNEVSGSLHGLMRVRQFVQDDAHIFCNDEMIQTEVSAFIDLLFKVYRDFGFTDVLLKLSTRPTQRVGSDEVWDKAEKALAEALTHKNLSYDLLPGEGAFYGPKIEFSLRDCIGRIWQCGTIQVDFSMPQRLDATYVGEDGARHAPVMLHRAIFGSLQRFMGILIEHYAGHFPFWLAPEQCVVMNITDQQTPYCKKIIEKLKTIGIRAISDLRNEKIGFKIREHSLRHVPYLLVVGDKEVAAETLTVRTQQGKDLGAMDIATLMTRMQIAIREKAFAVFD